MRGNAIVKEIYHHEREQLRLVDLLRNHIGEPPNEVHSRVWRGGGETSHDRTVADSSRSLDGGGGGSS